MSAMNSPLDARDGGEKGEAAAAALISDILGGDLVYQHAPGEAPQGIDVLYHDDGEMHTAEVKSLVGDWHQSYMSSTVDGRQMDAPWVADRLGRVGIEANPSDIGAGDSQIHTELFQVDFIGDTIARYDMGLDGRRAESHPSEVYALSDVLDMHEKASAPETEAPAAASREPGESEPSTDGPR